MNKFVEMYQSKLEHACDARARYEAFVTVAHAIAIEGTMNDLTQLVDAQFEYDMKIFKEAKVNERFTSAV